MIIGITGYAEDEQGNRGTTGVGKDTVADRLVEKHRFVKVALADPLKRICKDVFDFTDEQLWGPSEARNAPDPRYPMRFPEAQRDRAKEFSAKVRRVFDDLAFIEFDEEFAQLQSEGVEFLTARHALQQLGTEWGRRCYNDVWAQKALTIAKRLITHWGTEYSMKDGYRRHAHQETPPAAGVGISDVRFINEVAAIRDGGGKIVRVKRRTDVLSGPAATHESETQLLDIPDDAFDFVIENNDSITMLTLQVDRMMDVFSGRIREFESDREDVPPFKR